MKSGTFFNSKNEANFIGYIKDQNEKEEYIKKSIASINLDQFISYIKITHHDPEFRKVEYKINLPG